MRHKFEETSNNDGERSKALVLAGEFSKFASLDITSGPAPAPASVPEFR